MDLGLGSRILETRSDRSISEHPKNMQDLRYFSQSPTPFTCVRAEKLSLLRLLKGILKGGAFWRPSAFSADVSKKAWL